MTKTEAWRHLEQLIGPFFSDDRVDDAWLDVRMAAPDIVRDSHLTRDDVAAYLAMCPDSRS